MLRAPDDRALAALPGPSASPESAARSGGGQAARLRERERPFRARPDLPDVAAERRPTAGPSELGPLADGEVLGRYFAAADAKERGACVQELFRRHYPRVVAWCLRFAGNRDEAYDLAQGIFAKAHLHLGTFRRESRFTTWLYSITRSECLNSLRARRERAGEDEAELEDVVDEDGQGPHEALELASSARWVRSLLERVLDETEKQVFTLHYGDEVPLDAITRLLGLSNRSGAKAYIVSARRKLDRALGGPARDRTPEA